MGNRVPTYSIYCILQPLCSWHGSARFIDSALPSFPNLNRATMSHLGAVILHAHYHKIHGMVTRHLSARYKSMPFVAADMKGRFDANIPHTRPLNIGRNTHGTTY